MRRRRFGGLHLLLPLVLAGCTIYIGPYDDEPGGTANQGGDVVSPEEAQQAREAEAWSSGSPKSSRSPSFSTLH
jgi:hypothetical protein